MSADYALFIITVPNDLVEETTVALVNAVKDLKNTIEVQQSSSFQALPALIGADGLLSSSHDVVNIVFDETNDDVSNDLPTRVAGRERSLCSSLKSYLENMAGIEPIWMISDDKKTYQITFFAEFGIVSDHLLQELRRIGIGVRSGTRIFILPISCVVGVESQLNTEEKADDNLVQNGGDSNDMSQETLTLRKKLKNKINESDFKKSVRARLMVHQVVAAIRVSTALTFDFVILLILASMLAAFGLLENSTVIIVASMLVSPLMNPILGVVFGLSVREHSLWKCGLRNEVIGLLICLSCGFLLGLFTTFFETNWGSSTSFPTMEMRSRGDITRLWIGVLIALPSGAGVALSVLGGNTGSLVGVAISASLLPPAVNCGLLFAYALLGTSFSSVAAYSSDINDNQFQFKNILKKHSLVKNCTKYVNNEYLPLYSCNLATEASILGVCSLLLTFVNILCIIIMALIILRIKEVVPLNQTNDDITQFFHHDVRVARDYNKTIHQQHDGVSGDSKLAQAIVNRWKTFTSSSSTTQQQNDMTKHNNDSMNSDDLISNRENKSQNNFNYFIQCHNSKRNLHRLQTFAKEYDLDLYNRNDYEVLSSNSREKVQIMARDLLEFCDETQRMDLSRLLPYSMHKQQNGDPSSPYYELIGVLPPKWNEIFLYEQRLQERKSSFHRSYSLREQIPSFHSNRTLNLSFSEHKNNQVTKRSSLQRLTSLPEAPAPLENNTGGTIRGTRFQITKANDILSTVQVNSV